MNEKEASERPMLERIFLGYPTGLLRDFVNILELMKRHDITKEAFLERARAVFTVQKILDFEKTKQLELMRNKYFALARRCVCGEPMRLYRVNDRPGTQVGGEFKSMWYCPNLISCGETVYSNLAIEEEADRYGVRDFIPRQRGASTSKSDQSHESTPSRRRNAGKRCGRSPRR